jgi:hypothetical protein
MSRSPRRRKDTAWCRGCDERRVPEMGRGRCPECLGRQRKALMPEGYRPMSGDEVRRALDSF